MNLHAIASGVVAAVNPPLIVVVRVSIGWTKDAAGTRIPKYATPGALTGAIAGDVLTVSAVASGLPQVGQALAGAGIIAPTVITAPLSAGPDGTGTWRLNRTYTAPILAEAMTTDLQLVAQIQPVGWRDVQMMDGLNLSGERKKIYVSGDVNGVVRAELKGGDLVTTPEGFVWLVQQQLEGWAQTAGWTAAVMTLQNGG